ncbi:MAG: YihY/virulence factor BrkB family protein, partial [Proteobacteria bacterium]|nr:YihY/virulence factor BrkB family protein [Pseudomonadota bacterium]
MDDHRLPLVAAGVAFYAFLALIPTLVAVVSVYGLFADPAGIVRQVEDWAAALPEAAQALLVEQLTALARTSGAGVTITLVVAVAVALWSASTG